jgi:tetratricopeptide (TPR) repeat protein
MISIDINEEDLYKILGIDENADFETINKVYRKIAKEYHPDKFSSTNIEEKNKYDKIFSKITSAYNILKDESKRKQYDYERRLKIEYQKTLQNISNNNLTFTKPVVVKKEPEISISISNNKNFDKVKGKASKETINAQAESLYNSALSKISNKDYDGAILDLQTAIVINNQCAKYHSTLGIVMKEKGWLSYANAEFKKALNIDPKDKLALKYYQEPVVKNEEIKKENFINKIIKFIKKVLGSSD